MWVELSSSGDDDANALVAHLRPPPPRIGGSLGWKTRGSLDPDFEKVAYEIEPSTVGDPKYRQVKTDHGYHLIMVEGRK